MSRQIFFVCWQNQKYFDVLRFHMYVFEKRISFFLIFSCSQSSLIQKWFNFRSWLYTIIYHRRDYFKSQNYSFLFNFLDTKVRSQSFSLFFYVICFPDTINTVTFPKRNLLKHFQAWSWKTIYVNCIRSLPMFLFIWISALSRSNDTCYLALV